VRCGDGGLPAVEGSAWDTGAPLDERGADLADDPMNPGHHGEAASHSDGEELPTWGPGDVSVTVCWERNGSGLRGQVVAENTGSRACRLPGKPVVTPLGPDGRPLPAENGITLEMKLPGHVVLEPGHRAAPVAWGGWDPRRDARPVRLRILTAMKVDY
jgi:hypothetical protein